MTSLRILIKRLSTLLRGSKLDRDLDDEIGCHLDLAARENELSGMSTTQARAEALRQFGGVHLIKDLYRDRRGLPMLESTLQDIRYGARTLRRSPGLASVIVLTLALSIGANTAIFTVLHGVLLSPLPYPAPDRVVRIFLSNANFAKFRFNPFDYRDYRERSQSFDSLAGFVRHDVQISGQGDPQRLICVIVTSTFFQTLGFHPALGRDFEPGDEIAGNGAVAILSYRLWRNSFGGDPDIIGRQVSLDGGLFTVIGVMPSGVLHPGNDRNRLAHGDTVDIWIPFKFSGSPANRSSHYLDGIGRLKQGVTYEQAQSEMQVIAQQIDREHPGFDFNWRVHVTPLEREILGNTGTLLIVLFGAVAFVLMIACLNIANLLLARATSREREIAVRAALGAGHWRVIRQLLTESILLSVVGAAAGAVLAVAGVKILVSLLPAEFPRAYSIHLDASVFGFALVVALATGILFGLAPALHTGRVDLNKALHSASRSALATHVRFRQSLVVAEVAMASVLLIGAGLVLRSFVNLLRTDPGFRAQSVLTAGVSLPAENYKTDESVAAFYDRLIDNLSSLPGVQSAGAGTDLPWTGYNENTSFSVEGKSAPPNEAFHARYHAATPEYFHALSVPLIGGRFFTPSDDHTRPNVVIINSVMARRYWPDEDAVGKRITFTDTPGPGDWFTIVGIVGDVKDTPSSPAAEPAFWWPLLQQQPSRSMSIVVRSDTESDMLAAELRAEVHRLDHALAVADVRSMEQIADGSVATPRFTLILIGLFAVLAATLAATGTYGVVSYSVNRRASEFGLRMALGATARDIRRLVVLHGLGLAAAGVVIAGIAGLALNSIIRGMLYGVSSKDPLTFVVSLGLAIVVTAVACYLPARRATRSDPLSALRSE
jgi:predicted permease